MKFCRNISTTWAIAIYLITFAIVVLVMLFLYTNCAGQTFYDKALEKAPAEQKEIPQIKEFIKIYFNDFSWSTETNCGMSNEVFRRFVNERLYFYIRHGYKVTNIRFIPHGGFFYDSDKTKDQCYAYAVVWLGEK